MAEQVSSLIVRLIDQVSAPAKAIAAALRGIGSAAKGSSGVTFADRIDAAIARNNARLSQYRMQMLDVYATAMTLYRGLKKPIDSANQFQSALTELGNKSGMTAAQLKEFGSQAIAIGKKTNQYTGDILKGADVLIGFGMDADTAAKSLETIGRAATATGASIEDLSKLGYASISNLKVPVQELALAFDALDKAGKLGGFELKDMAQYFPELGAAAATFGQSGVKAVTDLGAALQIVRRSTGDASQAANALANLYQKARAPLTVKNFKKYGINLRKELEKGVKDGKSPIEVMVEQTRRAIKKGAILEDLFSDKQVQEAMRPLLAFFDDYKKLRDEAANSAGTVMQDFENKMKTNAERTKAFQIALDNLSISLGNALLPALTKFLTAITPIVDMIGKWAEKHPKLAAAIVGSVAGLLAFNAATIALKYAGALGYGGILTLIKGIGTLSGAFATLSGAIAATGIGAILILIALAGMWIYNNWKGISAMFDAFGRSFKSALGPEASAALSTVIGWVSKLWDWITKLTGPMDMTEAQWRRIGYVAGQALGGAVNWVMNLKENLASLWDSAKGKASEWGASIKTSITSAMEGIGPAMRGAVDNIRVWLDENLAVVQAKVEGWQEAGVKLGTAFKDGAIQAFNDFLAWCASLPSKIIAAIGKIDLSGILKWPSMPSWLGGGSAAPAKTGGIKAAPGDGAALANSVDGARAAGGPVSKGRSYLVGERRPEIFTPRQNGYINQGDRAMGGGATTIAPTFNINVSGNADASTVEKIRAVLRDEVRQAFRGVYADAGMRFA